MSLSGKKILVGITGSIAAYKTCELIRALVKLGAEVKAVMTENAKEFITETTIMTLTKNPVYSNQFSKEWKPEHISLADNADLFIIAPASANTIGKIANGICDNLLTSLVTAFKKPTILAPAMNCNMWENSFVQKNISALIQEGFYMVEPEEGDLACGYEGKGRMAEPQTIIKKVMEIVNQEKFLKGKRILITAGGTKEDIDPVRYIGNRSSGKMGIAIADAAYEFGAEVSLITTVNCQKPYKITHVESASDMMESVKKEFLSSDVLIMAAAVADYRPKQRVEQKIKKESETLIIELVKNPDILKEISFDKTDKQIVIGFCAESENLLANAQKKIKEKNLDFIVANDISKEDTGFNSDYNEVFLLDKNANMLEIAKTTKTELAEILLKSIFNG